MKSCHWRGTDFFGVSSLLFSPLTKGGQGGWRCRKRANYSKPALFSRTGTSFRNVGKGRGTTMAKHEGENRTLLGSPAPTPSGPLYKGGEEESRATAMLIVVAWKPFIAY